MIDDDAFKDDDEDLGLEDTGFDEFDTDNKDSNTLGDLWRNNPMFKVGVIVGGLALVIFAIIVMGGEENKTGPSSMVSGPDVVATPGAEGAPQAYVEAVVDENAARFEEALTTGGSAIPTPIDSRQAILSLGSEISSDGEDPLDRWRRLQRERQMQMSAQPVAPPPPDPQAETRRNDAVRALADLMADQMSSILETRSKVKVSSLSLTDPSYLEQLQAAQDAEAQAQEAEIAGDGMVTLIPAGEIRYAQLITQANSDVPGPVLAQIAGGPLSGARVLGSFKLNKELLTLSFTSIVIDDITYPINAIALDPATTLPGMATDVNRHYFLRIVLPAAAAFVEGFSSAVADSGRTSIVISGDTVTSTQNPTSNDQEVASGVAEMGKEIGSILDDMARDLKTTVIVAAGTPMGLLFLEPLQVPESAFK